MNLPKSIYWKSIAWLCLSMLVSSLNDLLTKQLSLSLTSWQICFFRFVFGSMVLLPFLAYRGAQAFKTERFFLHVSRAIFLVVAMGLYTYALSKIEMSTATVIGFTNPIFLLILARFFLKEQVTWPLWGATILAFIGIVLVFRPTVTSDMVALFACLLATILFSCLDIINKKYVSHEPMRSMLFFSNLLASFFMLPMGWVYGTKLIWMQGLLLSLLGVGSNLILYCILKAFKHVDAAVLVPIRYIEFLFSVSFGYLFFKEWPTSTICLGAGLIISCTCFIAYYQNR